MAASSWPGPPAAVLRGGPIFCSDLHIFGFRSLVSRRSKSGAIGVSSILRAYVRRPFVSRRAHRRRKTRVSLQNAFPPPVLVASLLAMRYNAGLDAGKGAAVSVRG
jgi:hypothetical protein